MTRAQVLKRAVAVALVAAAIWYLGHALQKSWPALRAFRWQVDPLLMAVSVVAQVGVLAWGVYVWSLVMRGLRGARVPFRPLLHVWATSSLARYIPGGAVWQLAAASQMAESRGLSRGRMVTSLLIHSGLVAMVAGVIGLLVLPLRAIRTGGLPPWAPWLSLAVVFTVHPRVINLGLSVLNRLTRRDLLRWEASWAYGIGLLLLQGVSWLLYGASYWIFLRSLAPFPVSAVLQVTGVFSLSFLGGFLSPSMGGIGVREVAMQRLLEPFFPASVAVLVAVVARFWTIAAELLTALLGVALVGRPRATGSVEPGDTEANPPATMPGGTGLA